MSSGEFPTVGTVEALFDGWFNNGNGVGDEGFLLEMATKFQIARHLETECERQETLWAGRMQQLSLIADPTGNTVLPSIRITRVDPANIFVGARPSLLKAPINFWPSITVRCGNLRPARSQGDQWNIWDADLYIEIMTYGGPVKKEQVQMQEGIDAAGAVNMQVHLLSSAVLMCIATDPTLGGVVNIENAPAIMPSLPAAVTGTNKERVGDSYIYMGRQLHFMVMRNSY